MDKGNDRKLNQNSFQQLKYFSDSLPVGNIIYKYKDGMWSVLFFNEMMCKIMGRSRDKCEPIFNDNFLGFVCFKDLNQEEQLTQDLIINDKTVSNVVRIDRRQGIRYVNLTAKIIEKNNDYFLVSSIFVDITDIEKEKQDLYLKKEEYEILTSLMETPKQNVYKYYFNTDTYEYNFNVNPSYFYFSRVQSLFTIEDFLDSDYIDAGSIEELRTFFDYMKSGIPNSSATFRAKDEQGNFQWYYIQYATVFNNKIEPQYAIIYSKVITDLRNNSKDAERFRNIFMIGANDTFLNIEYNLTTDRCEFIEGSLPDGFVINPDISLEESVEIISAVVHPEDRDSFKEFLSYIRIMNSFANGINRGDMDCRVMLNDEYIWIGLTCHVIRDPYNSNVLVWIACKKIDEKKQFEIKLTTNAQIDELTGLYNRRTFKERTIEKVKTSSEDLVSVFIIFAVNDFSRVNEVFGYSYGDKVLRDVARTARLLLSEKDEIGRYDGTTFVIYLWDYPDIETVQRKLELMQYAISRETEESTKLSVSIGATIYGVDSKDADELFEKAYIALDYAKEHGDSKYVFYQDKLEKFSQKSLEDNRKAYSHKKVDINYNIYKKTKDNPEKQRVDIRTLGYFDVFINGKAILIPNAKSKELLALLVHRKGGFVYPQEIIAHLWEDEDANKVTLARCRKVFMLLRDTLKGYGVDDILESSNGSRRIIPEKINCDLYNYLSGDSRYTHLYKGHYMLNYSWGEYGIAELDEHAKNLKN